MINLATIYDVAARAGVSTATVSRILSNDPTFSVKEETRRQVCRAVEELNYMPYIRVKKNAGTKKDPDKKKVGCFITPNSGRRQVMLTYEHQLRELERSLTQHNMDLAFTATEYDIKSERDFAALAGQDTAALVFMCNPPEPVYRRMRSLAPCAVGISCRMADIDNVTYDKEQSAQAGVTLLAQHGRRKIAFIGGPGLPDGSIETSRRYRGYEFGMRQNGLAIHPDYVRNCDWNVEACYHQTQEILRLSDPPDAIICVSDNMIFSVYRAIYEAGLQIPADIAVFSCKASHIAAFITPSITTTSVPVREMADAAVDLLERRIRGEQFPLVDLMLRSTMVLNDSI